MMKYLLHVEDGVFGYSIEPVDEKDLKHGQGPVFDSADEAVAYFESEYSEDSPEDDLEKTLDLATADQPPDIQKAGKNRYKL